MGLISVVVEDGNGNQIGERVDLPASMFPDLNDARFTCLRFIDPYGDTVFNRLQMPVILEELRLLKEGEQSHQQQNLIERIEALGKACQQEPHLYLKFIGD